MNPEWEVHIWGNKHLEDINWYNRKHINAYLGEIEYCRNESKSEYGIKHMYAAISDMMRYEILYAKGGFYVDADAFCICPLEDWLFDSDFCVVNENEDLRPGLLASVARHDVLVEFINNIKNKL